jgi:hypothetical protein
MPNLAPLSWLNAWADAFGAGLAEWAGAGANVAILHAGADGFTLASTDGSALFLPYTDDLVRAQAVWRCACARRMESFGRSACRAKPKAICWPLLI